MDGNGRGKEFDYPMAQMYTAPVSNLVYKQDDTLYVYNAQQQKKLES